MRKLIFFDIDGTLTGIQRPGHIYESTKEAIRRLEENGHFVALATGRAAFRAREFQKQIGIANMVCEGGNQIVIHHETISYEPMDQALLRAIYKEAVDKRIGIAVALEDSRIRYSPTMQFIEEAGDIHDFMEVRCDKQLQLTEDVIIRRLFLTLKKGDEERIPLVKRAGLMRYGEDAFCIIEPDDKYKGIRKIVEYFHEEEANVVVFGDGMNDRKMFQDAPFSIAMGNAIDELKEMADFITEDSDHDGIYLACKKYGWI